MTLMRSGILVLCGVALLTSCGGAEVVNQDESFLDGGKADEIVGGVAEGSGEACGVLRLASEASMEALDQTIGLDSRAAASIVAYRNGPDHTPTTADDERFDSLEELDALAWVGISAFQGLYAHVMKNGLACKDVTIQVLAISDWHGQLDPTPVTDVGNVGGAPAFAAWFAQERAANPDTLLLSAGDSYGASPPLASFFDEQPVVEAMNLMRFQATTLGNHEFDRGLDHLRGMVTKARYPYVSANIEHTDTLVCEGELAGSCITPFTLLPVAGVKVAVIGLTTPETAEVVKAGSLGNLTFADPVTSAQKALSDGKASGASVFVALAHIGGTGGEHPSGPIVDLAREAPGFDLVIGAHTHTQVNTLVNGVPVIETRSQGLEYFRVRMKYDFATRKVVERTVELVTPLADSVTPDAAVVAMLAPYKAELAARLDEGIGTTSGTFERGNNVERLQEVPLGNLVADSIRVRYQTDFAFVNGGGLRAPIPSTYAPANHALRRPAEGYAGGPPWDVVIGDAYAVLPFGNAAVTRTVTGQQLWEMLEHGVDGIPEPKGWFPQVSGFGFVYDATRPVSSRVVSVHRADGTPIPNDDTRYTLATSDFIDAGGDGYLMLLGGDGKSRDKMAEVLMDHIRTLSSLNPALEGRIVNQAAPATAR